MRIASLEAELQVLRIEQSTNRSSTGITRAAPAQATQETGGGWKEAMTMLALIKKRLDTNAIGTRESHPLVDNEPRSLTTPSPIPFDSALDSMSGSSDDLPMVMEVPPAKQDQAVGESRNDATPTPVPQGREKRKRSKLSQDSPQTAGAGDVSATLEKSLVRQGSQTSPAHQKAARAEDENATLPPNPTDAEPMLSQSKLPMTSTPAVSRGTPSEEGERPISAPLGGSDHITPVPRRSAMRTTRPYPQSAASKLTALHASLERADRSEDDDRRRSASASLLRELRF